MADAGPQGDIGTLVEIGESLLSQGDLEGSLHAFDAVLTADPRSVPSLLGTASALSRLGVPRDAYRYMDLAIATAPDSAAVWRTATSVALAAGDGAAAEQAAARRLELDGDGIDGLLDLALAAFFALDIRMARSAADEAARIAPASEAARYWDEKLRSISTEHELLVEVGRAHCRRGRYVQGLQLFDRALDLGDSYDARLYGGRALLELGEPEAAARQFEAAIRLAPGDADARADLDLAAAQARQARTAVPARAESPRPQRPSAPRGAYCAYCGARVMADDAFCTACGASTS